MKSSTPLLIFLLTIGTSSYSQQEYHWELQKKENGISIFTSSVKGSSYKAFKAITVINCNPALVVKKLRDVNSFKYWMAEAQSIELLKQSELDQYHYIETILPWPMENRDMVYHNQFIKTASNNYLVKVHGLANYIPPKKGISRIESVEGFWQIEQIDNTNTNVTYQIHAEPGGEIPAWLANTFIVDTPYKTLLKLKTLIEEK
jgi:hypothetical protein